MTPVLRQAQHATGEPRGQLELLPGDPVPGIGPGCVGGQFGADGQPGLTGLGRLQHLDRQLDVSAPAGRDRRHREFDLMGRRAVDLGGRDEPKMITGQRVITVADGQCAGRSGEDHRRLHRRELSQAGHRAVVGQHHAVHHEVAVVDHLAEVAAVAVEGGAVGRAGQQTMITPLPDEATVQSRIALGQFVVLGQCAGTVAHRMPVLAEQERLAAYAYRLGRCRQVRHRTHLVADRFGLEQVGIHPRVDVGVCAAVVALVVHRPFMITSPDPVGHLGEVAAGARFVAQRPDDDRRMVLVSLDRAFDPVKVGRFPSGIVARIP